MATEINSLQVIYRGILQQLFPNLTDPQLDDLLRSIDSDLTMPLRLDASATPDLIVHVGGSIVANGTTGRKRSIPLIGNSYVSFNSGQITFPNHDGGAIVCSPGASTTLICPSNQYVKVLIALDLAGNLVATPGSSAPSDTAALVPSPIPNTLPIGFVALFNNAGVIGPITPANIVMFSGGGGGGNSSTVAGFAQEVNVSNGATSVSVNFPSALAGTNYVVIAQLVNTSDANPQFQSLTITQKTTTGFVATWNAPVDSANYKLSYIIPTVQEQIGEVSVPSSATSITVSLPISLAGSNYSVIAELVDVVDGSPQFQPVTISGKTATSFTASWNAPTDSANYKLAFHVAQYQ